MLLFDLFQVKQTRGFADAAQTGVKMAAALACTAVSCVRRNRSELSENFTVALTISAKPLILQYGMLIASV
jgi:hypothetical protein